MCLSVAVRVFTTAPSALADASEPIQMMMPPVPDVSDHLRTSLQKICTDEAV